MTKNDPDKGVERMLEGLKSHIDDILTSIAAAENETHKQVQARIAKAAATTESTTAELEKKAADTSAAAKSRWDAFRSTVQVKRDHVAQQIEERAKERDAKNALKSADHAEQFAVDSVLFARLAIQNAEVSVLDAIDARLYAKDLNGEPASSTGADLPATS